MSKYPSLGKLTLLYSVGNLASKVISFALFFVYTFFLSKEEIGSFDLIISTITILVPILTLQINDAALRWLLDEEDPTKISKIISTTIVVLLLSVALIIVISVATSQVFEIKHLALISILLTLSTIHPIIQYIARGMGKNTLFAISGTLYSALFALLSAISLYVFDLKLDGLLIANSLAYLLTIGYLLIKADLLRLFSLSLYSKSLVQDLIKYSMPLIPNTLSWWVISMANRYIIIYFLGLSANGVFAVAMKFPSILLLFTNIFQMAWQEKAIQTFKSADRDSYYTDVFNKYSTAIFSAIVLLTAFTPYLIDLFVESSYSNIISLLPILYLSIGYQAISSFFGTGYLASKDTKRAFTSTIFGAITTISISFVAIPTLGLIGASLAILAGYIVLSVIRAKQTARYFSIRIDYKQLILLNATTVLGFIANTFDSLHLSIANIIFAIVVLYLINSAEILKAINYLRKRYPALANHSTLK